MLRRRRPLLAVSLMIAVIILSACGTAQAPAPQAPTATTAGGTSGGAASSTPTAQAVTASPAVASTTATAPAAGPTATGGAASTPVASGTPAVETLPPSNGNLKSANSCTLINSSDLAQLFPPHNEITRGDPKTGPVRTPVFANPSPSVASLNSVTSGPTATPTTAPAAASGSAPTGTETTCLFFDFHQPGSQTGWMLQVTYTVDVPNPSSAQAWTQAWAAAKAKAGPPVSGLGDDAFADGGNLYIKKGDTYLTFDSVDTHVDGTTPAGKQQLLDYNKQLAQAALSRLK